MAHGVVNSSLVSKASALSTTLLHVTLNLIIFVRCASTTAAQTQIPTVGGAEARAFHYVIAVGEKEQLLGVAAGPDSVLWVLAPSYQEARVMRIRDTDQNPVNMTVLANAVQFDAAQPKVSEVWKHTGRVVLWEVPVPLESGFRLALGDHAKVGVGYKVTLAWTPPNWKAREWTKEEEEKAKAGWPAGPARALGEPVKATVTLDKKQVAVEHSYRIVKRKQGLVAEAWLTAEGFESDSFDLPFVVEQKVQQVLEKGDKVEHPWCRIDVSSSALDCLPIDDQTVLVISRAQMLRSALATAFDRMQTQMAMAATKARPPYNVFLSFEKAYRSATLLAALLADRDLSAQEQKAVRLSLANATLFFRNLNLWTSTVQVPMPGGAARELLILFPKGAAEHRCAPTHALLHERLVGGRGYLGPVRLDKRAEVLELDFDAELAVDPFVLARANEELGKSGHRIGGLINEWTLSAAKPATDGLRSVRVTDQKQGRLALTIGLDAEKAGLVLWRLATGAGLPVRFKWGAGGQSGEVEIPFSLGRRARPTLVLAKGQLKNASPCVASVEYIQVGERFLFPKQSDAGLLLAKQSDAIAERFDLAGADPSKADLPVTAVVGEVHNPLDEFIQEENVPTVQFRIRNLLPARDDKANLTLRKVVVTVTQVRTDGKNEVEIARAGPITLLAFESDGSEQSVSFLKFGGKPGEKIQYRVAAQAVFTDGITDFRLEPVEGSELNLTASMLKK